MSIREEQAIVLKLEKESLDIRIPYDVQLTRILRETETGWDKIGSISEPEVFAVRPMSNVFLGMDEVLKLVQHKEEASQGVVQIQSFDRNTYNPRNLGDTGIQVGSIEDTFVPTDQYLSFELGYRRIVLNFMQFNVEVLCKNDIHYLYLNKNHFFGILKKDENTDGWLAYAIGPAGSSLFLKMIVLLMAYLSSRQRLRARACEVDYDVTDDANGLIEKCKKILNPER